MKILYIILLLIFTNSLYADDLAWVDKQIAAIKPPRVGISNRAIYRLRDPFIFLAKKISKKSHKHSYSSHRSASKTNSKHSYFVKKYSSNKLYLEAIINKYVLINGKWYKEGQLVYGYKIIRVTLNSALLQKQNRRLLLSTVSKIRNLKFHNK